MLQLPIQYVPEKSEDYGKSMLNGSVVANAAHNRYEVDEEAQLYYENKTLTRTKNYSL